MLNPDPEYFFVELNVYYGQMEKLSEDFRFELFRSTLHRLA